MAEASISVDQDQFRCPVCLDLLKDPVTIPCGHSYCMSCITDCWNQQDQKRIYRCPLCKQTFTPRPVLGRNVMFAEMVEKLKKTRLQSAPVPPVPARRRHPPGSGDVQCDSCTGRKQKAVKSCLECRSSYCQNHLEQHENLFSKRHNLMDATGRLQEMICTRHDKMREIYCRTDQRCICTLCLVDEHKYHDTVSTAEARTEEQRHFEEKQRNIQKRIQQRKKDLQQLREAVASHKRSAQTAVEDSERIFTELIRSIERRRSEVIQLIRDQERAAVSRAEERLERLEQEINDLRRRDAEMKQLSQTQDHVRFLQSLSSFSLSGSTDSFTVSSHLSFDEVVKSVSQLRDKLLQFCSEETEKISGRVMWLPLHCGEEEDPSPKHIYVPQALAELCTPGISALPSLVVPSPRVSAIPSSVVPSLFVSVLPSPGVPESVISVLPNPGVPSLVDSVFSSPALPSPVASEFLPLSSFLYIVCLGLTLLYSSSRGGSISFSSSQAGGIH
ncbi:Tripartite motif-containing protein 47 [Anabarilius grahami]|uniref:Tripartite motif-containing protein 47 n=1 Tax=Anabarilius grahami TaxID=495550 RepID=A0A3N0Y555_ANAGA|nr:Tripartite motif-containing protein 47 [Anabarilius grahami]